MTEKELAQLNSLPHQIVVYPNNSITIDGYSVRWTEKDFKEHKIPMIRVKYCRPSFWSSKTNEADHLVIKDTHIMIFSDIFATNHKQPSKRLYDKSSGNRHRNSAMR